MTTTALPFELAITIQSDTRYLASLRQLVDAAAGIVGEKRFPIAAKQAISLALIEAVDNAIFHAHDRCAEKPIQVVLSVADRHIRIDVGDRGAGLDHQPMTAPDVHATRGRGLFLMQSLVGKVESIKRGDTHWVRMTYKL